MFSPVSCLYANLKWQLTTFLPLRFPNGIIVGTAVAKTAGSFPFSLELLNNKNTGQKVSLFNHLVYDRNRSPVNLPFPKVTVCPLADIIVYSDSKVYREPMPSNTLL